MKVHLKAFRLLCFVAMDRFICSGMMSPGLPSQNILNISETTSLLEEEQRPLLPLYRVSEFLRFNVVKPEITANRVTLFHKGKAHFFISVFNLKILQCAAVD